MGRTAITLVVALITASLQCVAACCVLPCSERTNRPAPVEDCHHRTPAPSDQNHGQQDRSGCGHQTFISEVAPQASSVLFDSALVAIVPVVTEFQPTLLPVAEVLTDWSPPLRIKSASITILRL